MSVKLLPVVNSGPFIDSSGNPLALGLLYFYTAGSATPENTYTTSAGNVANANPVVLDSGGYPATGGAVVEVWGTVSVSYKIVLKTAAGVTVWTRDNVSGINDTTTTQNQWEAGPAPTYISATSFSLVGDQTSTFQVDRRVKTTNSGGTVYSRIISSAYTSLTTVTVANDSGVLDAGLSAVSYGLLSSLNQSIPIVSLLPITNSLAGDVALNNTSNYFTGPTVAQGTVGTWFASGTVVVNDTGGAAQINVKLWDGTTVIDSARVLVDSINAFRAVSLSGYLAAPAGNIRISVNDATATTGVILFNQSGNSKDSTLTAFRIA